MTTLDETIAADLAALAADNRRHIAPLDALLHTLAPPAATPARDLASLAAAQIYVQRCARAAAGAAATLCTLALLVWLGNPLGLAPGPQVATVLDHIIYAGPVELAMCIAVVVLVTRLAARTIAEHRVARSPLDVQARARSVAGLAAGSGVAGIACVAIVLGLSWFSISLDRYSVFWRHDATGALALMHHAMIGAILAVLAVSLALAIATRLEQMPAWLAHPVTTASGLVLGATTVLVGLRFDVGPYFQTFAASRVPSPPLRIALTITGTLAVLLVVASVAVRRHRREHARLTAD